jgi:hypothetical protein
MPVQSKTVVPTETNPQPHTAHTSVIPCLISRKLESNCRAIFNETTFFRSAPICHAQNTPVDRKTTNKKQRKKQITNPHIFQQSNTNILQSLRRNQEAKVGENEEDPWMKAS